MSGGRETCGANVGGASEVPQRSGALCNVAWTRGKHVRESLSSRVDLKWGGTTDSDLSGAL